ncbi:MAG: hypothetical protein KF809_15075 [Chloroflexi bacterium]|nr:hypothetical protein [Chloroflexota bacterium]
MAIEVTGSLVLDKEVVGIPAGGPVTYHGFTWGEDIVGWIEAAPNVVVITILHDRPPVGDSAMVPILRARDGRWVVIGPGSVDVGDARDSARLLAALPLPEGRKVLMNWIRTEGRASVG